MRLLCACAALAVCLGAAVAGEADKLIVGTEGDDHLTGGSGSDTFVPLGGQDRIQTGSEDEPNQVDQIAYNGDPFDGADVSAPDRQVVGNEDILEDFEAGATLNNMGIKIDGDTWFFDLNNFKLGSEIRFCKVEVVVAGDGFKIGNEGFHTFSDPQIEGCEANANVIILVGPRAGEDGNVFNIPQFNAGGAANLIAANYGGGDVTGVFLYLNVNTADGNRDGGGLNLNRLVYSVNLADKASDLKILMRDVSTCSEGAAAAIAAGRCIESGENIHNAVADAEKYVEDNFVFGRARFALDGFALGSFVSDIQIGTDKSELFIPLGGTDFVGTGAGFDRILLRITKTVDDFFGGAREESIFDFDFHNDQHVFISQDFHVEELNFLAIELLGVDGLHTPNIDHIPDDTNLWVLLNSDNGDDQGVFNARAAAGQIAGVLNAKGASPGAGFVIYFNEALQLTRLFYSPDLANGEAPLTILARYVDRKGEAAISALSEWREENFHLDTDGSLSCGRRRVL